jgi:hypothetical protein
MLSDAEWDEFVEHLMALFDLGTEAEALRVGLWRPQLERFGLEELKAAATWISANRATNVYRWQLAQAIKERVLEARRLGGDRRRPLEHCELCGGSGWVCDLPQRDCIRNGAWESPWATEAVRCPCCDAEELARYENLVPDWRALKARRREQIGSLVPRGLTLEKAIRSIGRPVGPDLARGPPPPNENGPGGVPSAGAGD